MKTIISFAAVALAVGWSSAVFAEAEQDKMLAEMKKCAVCKYMVENPELLKEMTWETHKIENGMLCLTTVPKELTDEFDAVSEKMERAIEQVKADATQGKEVKLCSFCSSMGEMMKLNAKQQHLDTELGGIHMVTSDDPAVVTKIHAFADKAIAEQKKMKDEEAKVSRR